MTDAPPSTPNRTAPGLDVAILDTTEMRWFADGPLPDDIEAWFTRSGSRGTTEHRCDTYRIDGRHDTGVKHRSRETPELKMRLAVDGTLALEPGPAGTLETWRRWSPAHDHADHADHLLVEDVCKRVIKRSFSVFGDEIVTGPPIDSGCEAEVAAVSIGAAEAWTFAFAAFGPAATRQDSLLACWRALLTPAPPPGRFTPSLRRSCGYPEWLAGAFASGRIPERQHDRDGTSVRAGSRPG